MAVSAAVGTEDLREESEPQKKRYKHNSSTSDSSTSDSSESNENDYINDYIDDYADTESFSNDSELYSTASTKRAQSTGRVLHWKSQQLLNT